MVYEGPLNFWVQFPSVYIVLGLASVTVLLLIFQSNRKICAYSSMFIALGTYLFKFAVPYYIFNGLVHFDIYTHYLEVKTLSSSDLFTGGYLYWPNSFILTALFELVIGNKFPFSISIIGLTSKLCLALLLFAFIRRLFGVREGVISLLLLVVVEPFFLHWCPFNDSVTIVILSFTSYFYGSIFRDDVRFKIISVAVSLISILYHPFTSLILGIMIISGVWGLNLTSKFALIEERVSKGNKLLALIILGATISWWMYVSFFVFERSVVLVKELTYGELTPLTPYFAPLTIPEMASQLEIMKVLSMYTKYIVLYPLIVIAFLGTFPSILRKELDTKHVKVLLLASVGLILGILSFIMGAVGFADRFYYLSFLMLMPLVGISILTLPENIKDRKMRKLIYAILSMLVASVLIISPLTDLSLYRSIHIDAVTVADEKAAVFTATYLPEYKSLTGDLRFRGIINYFKWPSSLFFSSEFNDLVKSGSFKYSSSTIIVAAATATFVTRLGVEDYKAVVHIAQLPDHFSIVYSNCYNVIYAVA